METLYTVIAGIFGSSVITTIVVQWFARRKTHAEAADILNKSTLEWASELKTEIKDLKSELRDLKAEISKLKDENEKLQETNLNLQDLLRQLRNELATYTKPQSDSN